MVSKNISPKFFSPLLTGSGGKTGVLNAEFGLGSNSALGELLPQYVSVKSTHRSKNTEVHSLPFSAIPTNILQTDGVFTPRVVDWDHGFPIKCDHGVFSDAVICLTPVWGTVCRTKSWHNSSTACSIFWEVSVTAAAGKVSEGIQFHHKNWPSGWDYLNTGLVQSVFTYDPVSAVNGFVDGVLAGFASSIDYGALDAWLDNFDVAAALTRAAQVWNSTSVVDQATGAIDAVVASDLGADMKRTLVGEQVRFLENYTSVPLDGYLQVYGLLKELFDRPDVEVLCNHNLNVLMAKCVDSVSAVARVVPRMDPVNEAAAGVIPEFYSDQQRDAMCSVAPLTMVQAGAGTGKSSVILGRIDYLVNSGVRPQDIMVLSFTNAAANNIQQKNPYVGSMTISKLIHDIYVNNFDHMLASVDTLCNSIDMYAPNDRVASSLKHLLLKMKNNAHGAWTNLNLFVQTHRDHVVGVLNRVGQTTLELETIISQQLIMDVKEPPGYVAKFLIIDEVQDNSIFDFVYALRYVVKHRCNVFIVGDPSQTLYEFRSANPRALNMLEASGVFSTLKLETNYRSCQEVLDLANEFLVDIEANEFANIQLRSNEDRAVTVDSFESRVHLREVEVESGSSLMGSLSAIFHESIAPYVVSCWDRGEQVAVLGFSRSEVAAVSELIEGSFPNVSAAYLSEVKPFDSDVLSVAMKHVWSTVEAVDPANAFFVFYNLVVGNLQAWVPKPAVVEVEVRGLLERWWSANGGWFQQSVSEVLSGRLPRDMFFEGLRRSLLEFEIRNSIVAQSLSDESTVEDRIRGANVVFSTIHGVKGLEFDHCVVVLKDDQPLSEEKKRLYYVALTRAKCSELVLGYSYPSTRACGVGVGDKYCRVVSRIGG